MPEMYPVSLTLTPPTSSPCFCLLPCRLLLQDLCKSCARGGETCWQRRSCQGRSGDSCPHDTALRCQLTLLIAERAVASETPSHPVFLPPHAWCGRYRCDICFVCHRQRHRQRGRSDTLAHCRRICCRHSSCRHSCYRLLRRICSRRICSRRICSCHTLEAHRCRSSSTTRLLCLCA